MKKLLQLLVVPVGLAIVVVATLAIFGLPVGVSLRLLCDGAFGDKFGIARTLVKATPLVLTGLGIVVAWRAGMYNIGGEGQFIVGSVCGAAAAKALWGLPGPVLNLAIVCACILGGVAYAGIAALLQMYRGVQVVISSILLNFVAVQILDWACSGPLRQTHTTIPLTDQLSEAVMLRKFDRQTDLHYGVAVALMAVVCIYIYLYLTKAGFKVRVVGENPRFATANRINVARVQLGAMLLSGGLCGLAGAVEYTGMTGVIGSGTSQNWGFLAIPVALLAGLHPLGLVPSGIFFGALFAGSDNLARFTPSGTTIVYIIQAVAVLAFMGLKSYLARRTIRLSEASL